MNGQRTRFVKECPANFEKVVAIQYQDVYEPCAGDDPNCCAMVLGVGWVKRALGRTRVTGYEVLDDGNSDKDSGL